MTLQIIKTTPQAFEAIQSGRRTAVIVKNDRSWSTYDEILFCGCNDEEIPTGKFVRTGLSGSQVGEILGLKVQPNMKYRC